MASIVGNDKGKSILVKFLEKIKEFISEETMEKALEDALVEKELVKRTQACVVCFETLQKLNSELQKIDRPDQEFEDDNGNKKLFKSKSRVDEIKKVRDKIDKHERALEKAFKGDMKDVYELNQQSPNKDKGSGGGKGPEGTPSEAS